LESDSLQIPHPRIRERAFVLTPLAEIAGDWLIPDSKAGEAISVAALADRQDRSGIRRTDLEI
jgi:2-amino-4-hydroxy-6-hydroxymethyldihydropteridine diphosphokinase